MNSTAPDVEAKLGGDIGAHTALLTLEAMRLGVVPAEHLDAYSVGREEELELVDSDLENVRNRGGAVRAFLGDYGTGKTHLLELIRQRALDANFAVARVVLNPDETAPSHPKRVYRELVRSIEFPDRQGRREDGLRPLLEQAADCEAVLEQFHVVERVKAREVLDDGAHLYWTPALRYFRALAMGENNGRPLRDGNLTDEEREEGLTHLMNWLEGHPTISNTTIDDMLRQMVGRQGRIFSMMDYRPWSRIYGYILSGLSTLAGMVGYEGLVVLIDEAEFYSLLSSQNREFAQILFKALAWASVGGDETPVPFSRDVLDLGGMGILQDLPPRYGTESGLYPVFAMTPNEEGREALQEAIPKARIAELERFEMDDYRNLAARVTDHYRRARPETEIADKLDGALQKLVAGLLRSGYIENPRQAMKFVVEFLDLAKFRPGDMKQVIGELRQIYG